MAGIHDLSDKNIRKLTNLFRNVILDINDLKNSRIRYEQFFESYQNDINKYINNKNFLLRESELRSNIGTMENKILKNLINNEDFLYIILDILQGQNTGPDQIIDKTLFDF